jgi:hypothetical protein
LHDDGTEDGGNPEGETAHGMEHHAGNTRAQAVSRDDVTHFLGDHWGKTLIVGAFVVGAYVNRLEGEIAKNADDRVYQETVRGIGRLVCVAQPDNAALAGIPCGELLNKGER